MEKDLALVMRALGTIMLRLEEVGRATAMPKGWHDLAEEIRDRGEELGPDPDRRGRAA